MESNDTHRIHFFLHVTYKSLAKGGNGGKTLAIMNSGPIHPRLCGIKGIGDAFTVRSCLFGQLLDFLNTTKLGLTPSARPSYLKCMAFISLREESYWRNKEHGGLSAFHSTSFQITAPRIEQVIARRFKYATLLIESNSEIDAEEFILSDLDLDSEKISLIFKTLQNSLLGEDRRFIRFLEYIAPGEVRQSLDLVARFLTSGHTNINRVMDKAGRGMISPIGFHEFLQAVMLGDRVHFKEEFSDIINIYAVDGGRGDQSHFNRLAVIARALSAVGENSEKGKGFIPMTDIVRDCESLGMTPETCMVIIGFLVKKRILVTDTFMRDSVKDDAHIRASAAAYYYITELAFEFPYLDLVIIDTEIGRLEARDRLTALSREIHSESDRYEKLKKRVERGRIFIKYIQEEFQESALAKASNKFDGAAKNLIEKLSADYDKKSVEIIESARLAFGRPL
jgi:hypothetical protein